MASDINKVILIGRLTRDPELKSTNSGTYFCRFSLASNHSFKKSNGTYEDKPGFFDCIAWGKSAEILHKYITKGRRICVEGSLRWSSWEGTDGKKQSKVEINVEGFQFLDPKQDGGEPSASEPAEQSGSAAHYDSGAMADDDIPF